MRLYPKLAANSIKSNHKLYYPYILMSSGIIAMFYIMSALSQSSLIKACKGGSTLITLLDYSQYIIAFFALLFMFFTNSFVIKKRTKELGLYNILGMNKKNIAGVMIWETLIMYISSFVIGIFAGIIFSKLAEAGLIKLADGQNTLDLSISLQATVRAFLVFAGIFILIFLNSVRVVSFTNPAEMIKSERFGEKAPRGNIVLAVIGIIMIIAAYISVFRSNAMRPDTVILNFFIAIFPVIAGTYLIFIAGSVMLCKLLQKDHKYYYNKKHFVPVANMAWRMKRSGAGLATIAILTTMVLIMLTSTICFYNQIQSVMDSDFPRENVFTGTYSFMEESDRLSLDEADALLSETVKDMDGSDMVSYPKLNYVINGTSGTYTITDKDEHSSEFDNNDRFLSIISEETYNKVTGSNVSLGDNEVLIASLSKDRYEGDKITLDNKTYNAKHIDMDLYTHGRYYLSNYLVVMTDPSPYEAKASGITVFIMFNKDMNAKELSTFGKATCEELKHNPKEGAGSYKVRYDIGSRSREHADYISVYSGLIFLGTVLTILFLGATFLLMYYRQTAEGHEDYGKYRILQNIGMTSRDIKASVNSMTFATFTAPLIAAMAHTAVAMYFVYQFMIMQGMFDTKALMITAAGVYLTFAVIYFIFYKLTSRSYLKIVGGV